ncbi:MAG: hypothetical protein KUG77_12985 [Nannocystaceae bacterium]|nr:hypothetical protein [Nannocystaceae bacterium]
MASRSLLVLCSLPVVGLACVSTQQLGDPQATGGGPGGVETGETESSGGLETDAESTGSETDDSIHDGCIELVWSCPSDDLVCLPEGLCVPCAGLGESPASAQGGHCCSGLVQDEGGTLCLPGPETDSCLAQGDICGYSGVTQQCCDGSVCNPSSDLCEPSGVVSDIGGCDAPTFEAAGCSFVTASVRDADPDASRRLWFLNDSDTRSIEVTITIVLAGTLEEIENEAFVVEPGAEVVWGIPDLGLPLAKTDHTSLRAGGYVSVATTAPLRVEQELEPGASAADRWRVPAMRTLSNSYTLTSETASVAVLATSELRVQWLPTVDTGGNGLPVEPVAAGASGEGPALGAGDVFRIAAADGTSSLLGTSVWGDVPFVCLGCDPS